MGPVNIKSITEALRLVLIALYANPLDPYTIADQTVVLVVLMRGNVFTFPVQNYQTVNEIIPSNKFHQTASSH